jgi:hypothetical protein
MPAARVTADICHLAWQTGKQRASYELLLGCRKADGRVVHPTLNCWFLSRVYEWEISVLQHITVQPSYFLSVGSMAERENSENRNVFLTSRQFAKNMSSIRFLRLTNN